MSGVASALLCCCNPPSPCTCALTAIVITWPATIQFVAPGFNYQNDPNDVIPFSAQIIDPSWVLLKSLPDPTYGCNWTGTSGVYALQYPGGPNGSTSSLLVRFIGTLAYQSVSGTATATIQFQFTPDFIGFDDPAHPPVFGIGPQIPVSDLFHSPAAETPCPDTGTYVNPGSLLVPSTEHAVGVLPQGGPFLSQSLTVFSNQVVIA